ncbi:MAG: PCRF domain-containing protein, partial [Gammaproteobacteria bacterium]
MKKERLEEVSRELEDPSVWQKPEKAQELGKERSRLGSEIEKMDAATRSVTDSVELLELAEAEDDEDTAREVERDLPQVEAQVRKLELKRMFRGEMDSHNAYLDIQAGAGG